MFKSLFLVFVVLCCSLFVYSCTSEDVFTYEDASSSCGPDRKCEVGYGCFSGTCLHVDVCGNLIPDGPAQEVPVTEVYWPDSCHEYVFQNIFYITDLHINDPVEEEPCCYDLGGRDGEIDNKTGLILQALSGLLYRDANIEIVERIAAGTTVILFEFRVVYDDIPNNQSIIMSFFYGSIDGCTDDNCSVQTEAATGDGIFSVSEDFFESDSNGCTGTPSIKSGPIQVHVENYHLVAGPFQFILPLPISSFVLELEVQNVWIEADLTYDSNVITLTNGKLGGTIPVVSFIDGFNQYAREWCSCLEILNGNQLMICEITSDAFVGQCVQFENNCDYDSSCDWFGNLCSMLTNIIAGQADIDTDGDGVVESLSVGITFEAVSAQVTAP